jgi:hypothetical protein
MFNNTPITNNVIYVYINHFNYAIANYIVRDKITILHSLNQTNTLNITKIADSINNEITDSDKLTIVLQSNNYRLNQEIIDLLTEQYQRYVSNDKVKNDDKVSDDFLYWLSHYDSNKIVCDNLFIRRQIEKIKNDYDVSNLDSRILPLVYGYERLNSNYHPISPTIKSYKKRYDGYGRRGY